MRLWSLHPKYLDRMGLLACWREALLAQKVLQGGTRGYRNHPQLNRFLTQSDPLAAIGSYLVTLTEEAEQRGYHFDHSKINPGRQAVKIPVTRGQLAYEWAHLQQKIHRRDPQWYQLSMDISFPEPHPSFEVIEGDIETWERIRTSTEYKPNPQGFPQK
jgi:hypothetical protein